jgi:nuclear GTP-binding protein
LLIIQRPHIVDVEPFSETFGPKAQRKRPRVEASSFEELGKLGSAIEDELESKAEVAGMESSFPLPAE